MSRLANHPDARELNKLATLGKSENSCGERIRGSLSLSLRWASRVSIVRATPWPNNRICQLRTTRIKFLSRVLCETYIQSV